MKKYWLILGLSVCLLSSCGPKIDDNSQTKNTEQPANKAEVSQVSLKDLLKNGKDQKCTWTASSEEGQVNGTVYISGNKFKQEMTVNNSTTATEDKMYSLSDGEYLYTWGSLMPGKGYKVLMKQENTEPETENVDDKAAETENEQTKDLNTEYDYNCESWSANTDEWTLPDGVSFQDLQEIMNQMQKIQKQPGGALDIPTEENDN